MNIYDAIDLRNAYRSGFWIGFAGGMGSAILIAALLVAFIVH